MGDREEVRAFWDRIADDWELQVGEDGDLNRRLISDPVLWRLAGKVRGLTVLDVGCGTGYLARKLHEQGAGVVGVDVSERMIEIARRRAPEIDFRVDSCATLSSVGDTSIDLVLANYVLMDTPELEATVAAFHRVLKPAGAAVAVFSHPCFAQGRATETQDGEELRYHWDFSYFERQKRVDPPWAHFTSDFVWFHRPLSDYWKAFRRTGFDVVDFEEPRLEPEREHLVDDERWRLKARSRPYSVAFKLIKPATSASAPPRPASS